MTASAHHPPDVEITLVRHAATEWSVNGRHTGRTDIDLTPEGRAAAEALGPVLESWKPTMVLSSPLKRAAETCRLAGLGDRMIVDADLVEWDYGDYEGLTTREIRARRPGWLLWNDGVVNGETIEQVCERVDRVIARARAAGGRVAMFAHGHVLRVLGARWTEEPPQLGKHLELSAGSLCLLGHEHDYPVLSRWNVVLDEVLDATP